MQLFHENNRETESKDEAKKDKNKFPKGWKTKKIRNRKMLVSPTGEVFEDLEERNKQEADHGELNQKENKNEQARPSIKKCKRKEQEIIRPHISNNIEDADEGTGFETENEHVINRKDNRNPINNRKLREQKEIEEKKDWKRILNEQNGVSKVKEKNNENEKEETDTRPVRKCTKKNNVKEETHTRPIRKCTRKVEAANEGFEKVKDLDNEDKIGEPYGPDESVDNETQKNPQKGHKKGKKRKREGILEAEELANEHKIGEPNEPDGNVDDKTQKTPRKSHKKGKKKKREGVLATPRIGNLDPGNNYGVRSRGGKQNVQSRRNILNRNYDVLPGFTWRCNLCEVEEEITQHEEFYGA